MFWDDAGSEFHEIYSVSVYCFRIILPKIQRSQKMVVSWFECLCSYQNFFFAK